MKIKRALIILLCFFLISSITSCAKDNKSAAEENYLDEKIFNNESIRELLQLTKDQSIEYAGKYIDSAGILNIELVYNSSKGIGHQELLKRIDSVNSEGKVSFQDAQFSYTQLKSAYDILCSKMRSLGLTGVGIYETENRVNVTVLKYNDKIRKQISKIVDISLIQIEESEPAHMY